jgi:hypothetical protein
MGSDKLPHLFQKVEIIALLEEYELFVVAAVIDMV